MFRHPQARPGLVLNGRAPRPQNHPLPLLLRLGADAPAEADAQGELARPPRVALVEAALLAADEPLTARRLAVLAGLPDAAEARRLVEQLRALLDKDGSAFQVEELAGGYQLLTRAEFHPWLVRLRRAGNEAQMTAAAREALAIVAYRQPIARADVEGVRGVQSGAVLQQLMEKGLVRIAGHDDSLGRPLLYATTRKFLQVFGLRSLGDLPQAEGLAPPTMKEAPEGES